MLKKFFSIDLLVKLDAVHSARVSRIEHKYPKLLSTSITYSLT